MPMVRSASTAPSNLCSSQIPLTAAPCNLSLSASSSVSLPVHRELSSTCSRLSASSLSISLPISLVLFSRNLSPPTLSIPRLRIPTMSPEQTPLSLKSPGYLTPPSRSSPIWPPVYHTPRGPITLNIPVIPRAPQMSRTLPMPQLPFLPQTTLRPQSPRPPPNPFLHSPSLVPLSVDDAAENSPSEHASQANLKLGDAGNNVSSHDATTQGTQGPVNDDKNSAGSDNTVVSSPAEGAVDTFTPASADNSSASSSALLESCPSGNHHSAITPGTSRGEKRAAPDDKYDLPFNHATFDRIGTFDEVLRLVVSYLLDCKTISQFQFDAYTFRMNKTQQYHLRWWALALMPDFPKAWKMHLFPDCRGKPFEGTTMCVHSVVELPKDDVQWDSVVCQNWYGRTCPRHTLRPEEPAASEKTVWCLLEWPECVGEGAGPCTRSSSAQRVTRLRKLSDSSHSPVPVTSTEPAILGTAVESGRNGQVYAA
ncbi:hypothetical protein CLAIMM_02468 [Cladophialophora immunda]|nr:hypothetical protein CLAIMM_02468 [Cladophialophora immunda]